MVHNGPDQAASTLATHVGEEERHPKRIILRLRVDEFISCHPTEFDRAIIAYLESVGRRPDELTKRLHQPHIEPFQDPSMKQKSFHIVLDLEKDMISEPDMKTVPHEAYRVRRAQDGSL
ncbi:uncharacterized protein LDX57_003289 [Aspergillus melleus]|uniref:uncharacterized protein n=1 Tax=Aspergillus melleus TaxID=138277 RepID=UPI001E8D1C07|nr:uncharacterized protein LDX57_003289 [Aspergillus melleus]KAH8425538.1 hypothetical protein LDX57_003289 [Aspergillus melleus]